MKHEPKMLYEPDMLDACECSCGWRSSWFYDGREHAYYKWKKHVEEMKAKETKDAEIPFDNHCQLRF